MDEDNAILFAWQLGNGGPSRLDTQAIGRWRPGKGVLWVHIDRTKAHAREWLRDGAKLDPFIVDALLQDETRPRVLSLASGLLVNLRGVNLNPGADPEDMVSVRMWVDPDRLISLRGPRLMAAEDVAMSVEAGRGPDTTGTLLVALAEALVSRMGPVVSGIEDTLDAFEQAITDDNIPDPSAAQISSVRRRAIELRRHLAPQREVLIRLAEASESWLTASEKLQLRQAADHVTRLVENLDAARERGAVTHEEVSAQLSLRMNRNMYLLSVVAVVFLPLSFITGLLGINVGGIPGAQAGWAFFAVCVGLVILLVGEVWFLRRRSWLE